jgi:hypothetical protein
MAKVTHMHIRESCRFRDESVWDTWLVWDAHVCKDFLHDNIRVLPMAGHVHPIGKDIKETATHIVKLTVPLGQDSRLSG